MLDTFAGFVTLEASIIIHALFRASGTGAPTDCDSTPSGRVYGPDGVLGSLSVTLAASTYTISSVSRSGTVLTVTTSAAHGLVVNQRVTQSGCSLASANSTFTVATVPSTTTFTVAVANSGGTSGTGGTGHLSGLYQTTIAATAANGFEAGKTYMLLAEGEISSVAQGQTHTFVVT